MSPAPRALHGLESWARALAVAGIVVAADQITKQVVDNHVDPHDPVEIIFGLDRKSVV